MIRYIAFLFFLICSFSVMPSSYAATPVPTEVSGVAIVLDGYTLEFDDGMVRLKGISAPEMKEPRGPVARAAMDRIISDRKVTCEITGRGKDKHLIGVCTVDGLDIGAELIRQGYAFVYRIYAKDKLGEYDAAEREAIAKNHGFWEVKDRDNLSVETWALICAVIVSLASVALALYEGRIQRNHMRLSVRPVGETMFEYSFDRMAITFHNRGLGVMIINSLKVIDANMDIHLSLNLVGGLGKSGIDHQFFVFPQSPRKLHISQGDSIPLFVHKRGENDSLFEETCINEAAILSDISIEIIYEDIYGVEMPIINYKLDWFQRHNPRATTLTPTQPSPS